MNFWKTYRRLRGILMLLFSVAGLILTLTGWSMTGQLAGLLWMLVGIGLMLTALFLYNKAYQ